MKKYIVALMCIACLVVLCGCSENKEVPIEE